MQKLILLLLVFCSFSAFAQIDMLNTDTYEITLMPNNCFETADCDGLVTEYIITNVDQIAADSLGNEIVGTSDNMFTPLDIGISEGTYQVTAICYDLSAIQNLVNDMNSNPNCCGLINGLTPDGVEPLICDGVIAQFPDGDAVTDLSGVLNVIAAFGSPSLSVQQFMTVAGTVNENAAVLALICTSSGAIAYCVNPDETETLNVTADPNISVDEINTGAVTISPNPIVDMMTLTLENWDNGAANLAVYDTNGSVISEEKITVNNNTTINKDLSQLSTGLYMVIIDNGTERVVKKFVKK